MATLHERLKTRVELASMALRREYLTANNGNEGDMLPYEDIETTMTADGVAVKFLKVAEKPIVEKPEKPIVEKKVGKSNK